LEEAEELFDAPLDDKIVFVSSKVGNGLGNNVGNCVGNCGDGKNVGDSLAFVVGLKVVGEIVVGKKVVGIWVDFEEGCNVGIGESEIETALVYGIIVGGAIVNKFCVGVSVGKLDGVGGNLPHQQPFPHVS